MLWMRQFSPLLFCSSENTRLESDIVASDVAFILAFVDFLRIKKAIMHFCSFVQIPDQVLLIEVFAVITCMHAQA